MSTDPYDTLTGIPVASQAYATDIVGPPFLGWTFQLLGYGIALHMFTDYVTSNRFKRDPFRTKCVLLAAMTGTTIQSGLSFASIYHYGTSQNRDAVTLYSQTVVDCFITLPAGFVGMVVQSFLVYRASALFNNAIAKAAFLTLTGLCILAAMFGAVLYTVVSFLSREGKFDALPDALTFNLAVGLWEFASAFVDIVISVTLILLLRKKILGFNNATDSMIKRLIRLALETACYTALSASTAAGLAFAFPDESLKANLQFIFALSISSLYMISLMTTLVERHKIQSAAVSLPMSLASKQLAMPRFTPHSIHLASHGESSHDDGQERRVEADEALVGIVSREQQVRPSSPMSDSSRKEMC